MDSPTFTPRISASLRLTAMPSGGGNERAHRPLRDAPHRGAHVVADERDVAVARERAGPDAHRAPSLGDDHARKVGDLVRHRGRHRPTGAARGGGEILDHGELDLRHRHDDQLRDALAGLDGESWRCRGSSTTPSAGPGSPNRSGPRDCRARCRVCGPGPSAAGSSRLARVVDVDGHAGGNQRGACPAPASRAHRCTARRSRPAEPAVA